MSDSPSEVEIPMVQSLTQSLLLLAGVVLGAVVRGWAILLMWGWFITPLGVAELELFQAMGLPVFVSLLTHRITHRNPDAEEHKTKELLAKLLDALLQPLLFLALGWLLATAGGLR